jgi:hypothetical protein
MPKFAHIMIQELLVFLFFAAATYFIGKRLWDNFRHKKVNAGCAKCDLNEK